MSVFGGSVGTPDGTKQDNKGITSETNRQDKQDEEELKKCTLDKRVERLIAMPEVLAPIVREVVTDLKGCSLEGVFGLLETEKPSGKVKVLNLEDLGQKGEAFITFGSYVEVALPERLPEDRRQREYKKKCSVYTNIVFDTEIQHDRPGKYVLEDRAQYYAARLVSRQLSYIGEAGEEYAKLIPVYTVWIVRQPYATDRGYVRHFEFRDEIGTTLDGYGTGNSLMHVVMVYLPSVREGYASDNELIKYLMAVFTNHLEKSESTRLIQASRNARKEVEEIMSLDDIVREEGRKEEREKGRKEREKVRKEGIIFAIKLLLRNNKTKSEIYDELLLGYDLSEEEFSSLYQEAQN